MKAALDSRDKIPKLTMKWTGDAAYTEQVTNAKTIFDTGKR